MAFQIHLKQFDGPLDLLLTLIGKAKIEPRDIFVSEVTSQYVEIVRNAPDFDMDDASEFIRMAALLVEIKSRHLLPKPPAEENAEEDPEAQLIARLEEYQRFKEGAKSLSELEAEAKRCYGKLPEEIAELSPNWDFNGLTLSSLWNALSNIASRAPKEAKEATYRPRQIKRDLYTVEECIERILEKLRFGGVSFPQLFSPEPSREEAVTLFMALLEVLKLGHAHVEQKTPLSEIMLWPGPAPLREEAEELPSKRGRKKRKSDSDKGENNGTKQAASGD